MLKGEDRAHEIADELIGTCLDGHAAISDEEYDDPVLMSQIDELCFECDGCGWWHSTDDLTDGDLCPDCCKGEDDDD